MDDFLISRFPASDTHSSIARITSEDGRLRLETSQKLGRPRNGRVRGHDTIHVQPNLSLTQLSHRPVLRSMIRGLDPCIEITRIFCIVYWHSNPASRPPSSEFSRHRSVHHCGVCQDTIVGRPCDSLNVLDGGGQSAFVNPPSKDFYIERSFGFLCSMRPQGVFKEI